MARKKGREPDLSAEEKPVVALEQITATQQRFVETLLTGKSIAEAARLCRIGRRTATYWMQQDTVVRVAYEAERQKVVTAFRERILNLHDLVLTALEDALTADAYPELRASVAKFLYSSNLASHGTLTPLADADHLVSEILSNAHLNALLEMGEADALKYLSDE